MVSRAGDVNGTYCAGAPVGNGYVESFIGKFRDEWRNGEVFWSGEHAQVIVERWRRWYNEERPHSA